MTNATWFLSQFVRRHGNYVILNKFAIDDDVKEGYNDHHNTIKKH